MKSLLIAMALLWNYQYQAQVDLQVDSILQLNNGDSLKVAGLCELSADFRKQGRMEDARKAAGAAIRYAEQKNNIYDLLKAKLTYAITFEIEGNDAEAAKGYVEVIREGSTKHEERITSSAWNSLANVVGNMGQVDSAIHCYQRAIAMKLKLGDPAVTGSIMNLGITFSDQGRYKEAMEAYLQAVKEAEKGTDQRLKALCYSNLGNLCKKMDLLEDAEKYLLKSLDINKASNNLVDLAGDFGNLGILFLEEKHDTTKALFYYEEQLRIGMENDLHKIIGRASNNIGNIYSNRRDFITADKYYQQALEHYEMISYKRGIVSAKINISENELAQNNFDKALTVLLSVQALVEELQSLNDRKRFYLSLSKAYEAKGKFKDALGYRLQYEAVKDSLYNEESHEQIAELQTRYESEKKAAEILRLDQENKIQTLETQKAKTTAFVLTAVLVAILFLSLWIVQRIRTKSKLLLAAETDRQQKLSINAVIEAQEEERRRIARELHDSVGQQLGALKLRISQLTEGKALGEQLEKTITEVRGISHQMLPVSLEHYGLVPALEELVRSSFEGSQVECSFDSWGLEMRPDAKTELTAYRICQEIISNVIKHSQAHKLHLSVYKAKENLVIMAEDNGKGMSGDTIKTGMGLLNMKARVINLNGSVRFENASDSGLITTVQLPFAA